MRGKAEIFIKCTSNQHIARSKAHAFLVKTKKKANKVKNNFAESKIIRTRGVEDVLSKANTNVKAVK